jgi:DNA-binding MarR family transcriptional regulator
VHPDIDVELVRGLAEFRRVVRGFLAASEGISKAAGITAVQYQAMLAICAWEGPMAVRDLADQLILTHSAAVQMVHKLCAAGLVRRESAQEDRRLVRVALTQEGGRLLASLAQVHLDELQDRADDLEASLERLKRVAADG